MQHYSSSAFTDIGKPAGGATITVKLAGTLTNASIFSDDGVTPKSNPFTGNSLGQFDFYAASGKYDITITGAQLTTYTLSNQVLFDPFEQTAADTGMVVKGLTVSGGPAVAAAGLTVPPGQVIAADQVAPPNSAGIGGFFGGTVYAPVTSDNLNAVTYNANEVRCIQFVLPFRFQVGHFALYEVTGQAASTGDIGIYDQNGNRVVYTGGFATTANTTPISGSISGGAITLPAGVYYFAWTDSASGITWQKTSAGVFSNIIFNQNGAIKAGVCANAATAGVLPTTLGAISAIGNLYVPVVYFER